MKKLNDIEQLDALFKQQLDKATVPAPPEVWSNVASSAGIQSASTFSQVTSYFSSVTNLVKLALFVGGTATVGILLYDANTKPPVIESQNSIIENNENGADESIPYVDDNETDVQSDHSASNADNINQAKPIVSQNPNNNNAGTAEQGGVTSDNINPANNTEPAEGGVSNIPIPTVPVLSIVSSNTITCIGQTKTFSSSNRAKGNWFINGKEVKKESEVMSHRFADKGEFTIELRTKSGNAQYKLAVNSTNAAIQAEDLNNGQYALSLTDPKLKVSQWLMNGSVLSTDQTVNARLQAGTVHIGVEVSDGECTYFIEKALEIKSKGSFSSPNIFTPNGDDKNDEYIVKITNYQSFSMIIMDDKYNRVFETKDPNQGWNGKVSNIGENCKDGIYIVKINYTLIGEEAKSELIKLTLKR